MAHNAAPAAGRVNKIKVANSGGEIRRLARIAGVPQQATARAAPSSSSSLPRPLAPSLSASPRPAPPVRPAPQFRPRPAPQAPQVQRNTTKMLPKADATARAPSSRSSGQITISTNAYNDMMDFLTKSKNTYSQMRRNLLAVSQVEGPVGDRAGDARHELYMLSKKTDKQISQLRDSASSASNAPPLAKVAPVTKAAPCSSPPKATSTVQVPTTPVKMKVSSNSKPLTPVKGPSTVQVAITPVAKKSSAALNPSAPAMATPSVQATQLVMATPQTKSTPPAQAATTLPPKPAPVVAATPVVPSTYIISITQSSNREALEARSNKSPPPASSDDDTTTTTTTKSRSVRPRPAPRSIFQDPKLIKARSSASITYRQGAKIGNVDPEGTTRNTSVDEVGSRTVSRVIKGNKAAATAARRPLNDEKKFEAAQDEKEFWRYKSVEGIKEQYLERTRDEAAAKKDGGVSSGSKRKHSGDDGEGEPQKRAREE